MNKEVIYFSVNNWFCGTDYPPTKNFKKWLGDDLNQQFTDDEEFPSIGIGYFYGKTWKDSRWEKIHVKYWMEIPPIPTN